MGAYALLAIAVSGMLAARLARGGETASVRLLPLLGAGHVLLLTAAFTAPAAAVAVGTLVFDGGVTPGGGRGRAGADERGAPDGGLGRRRLPDRGRRRRRGRSASRVLAVVSAVFALGLMLPPVGWAVTYLMAFWFAGVGIWLWRRG